MRKSRFEVDVSVRSALEFAALSGDWNPLHTDPEHAARTPYRHLVLHGAFSAGLVSRMAGMFLPGTDCLLHSMQLRFLSPIIPPATLIVEGSMGTDSSSGGRVKVSISDASSGIRYVDAAYHFGHHIAEAKEHPKILDSTIHKPNEGVVIVTGANGGLGGAICSVLGSRAIGVSRNIDDQWHYVPELERLGDEIESTLQGRCIDAIVHCAWPVPDNVPLTGLTDISASVDHFVAAPLRQMISLSQLLRRKGTGDAMLLLVGSAFAQPGRHNYRMPLYSVGKAMIPAVTQTLALELGASGQRCAAIAFDVLDTGMNKRMSQASRLSHANRVPNGELPSATDAASQISWVLDNRSSMVSGAVLSLLGGAIP